ncbi:MAG: hemerythrin domain-containing protein [Tissierellia bacterium]|nr:hemerythrin domain-containing protein [Tissierellia bacterium]
MFTIDVLEQEHEEIKNFVQILEEECIRVMNGNEVREDFFRASISFIREFADATHHKKEEDILFKYMLEQLGPLADKLIRNGMLMEHQMGRYHNMQLEEALNHYVESPNDKDKLQIIAHAMGYANLLRSHIEKENTAVYPFGERSLSDELKKQIDEEMKERMEEDKKDQAKKEELLKIIYS